MPPEIKIKREDIALQALSIIEERGESGLSARTLAQKLGSSVQPIYREFGDMDGVRAAALECGWRVFSAALGSDPLDSAVNYVMFALEHGNLFEFLFASRHCEYDGLDDMAHKILPDLKIIESLSAITGLDSESVYRVHFFVWMALHGMACMSAHNSVRFSRDEIKKFTMDITRGMAEYARGK